MGWLEEMHKKTVYHYASEEGDTITGTLSDIQIEMKLSAIPTGEPNETFEFDGKVFTRKGFEPRKMGGSTRVAYEQNGRKAYKLGNKTCISATKEQYLKTGNTSSVLSNSYQKEMDKRYDDTLDFHTRDAKRTAKEAARGKVGYVKASTKKTD